MTTRWFYYVRLRDGRWLAGDRVPFTWSKRSRLALADRARAEALADAVRAPWNGARIVSEKVRGC